MKPVDAIHAAAEHLWLYHRDIIEEHTDYASRLYHMYQTVERVCERSVVSSAYIARVSNVRRMIYWHRSDLEMIIDVEYRRNKPRETHQHSNDQFRISN